MVHIAHKTLAAIKQAIESDQGAKFRTLLRELMPLAEDAYRGEDFPFRSHLGASRIGDDCARALWYDFRWAHAPKHSDRVLRLFNRGHLEEPRFCALLGAAGIKVYQYAAPGKQYTIALFGGHFGGSLDGVAEALPDATGPTLCEFKTHGKDSFTKLAGKNWQAYLTDTERAVFEGEGVRRAKFVHYVQMQMYMSAYQLSQALYLAVCKDDDALYGEIVQADEAIANAFANRARELIFAGAPPARIKNDRSWWQCKFCDKAPVCYGDSAPARNCRTCEYSEPMAGGAWICNCLASKLNHLIGNNRVLSKQEQAAACAQYKARKI